jgi:tetratricopeptide (TPR) repeat protein
MAIAPSWASEHDRPAIPLRCRRAPDVLCGPFPDRVRRDAVVRARAANAMTSLRALLDEAAKRAAAGSIDDALAAYAEALACAPKLPEAHYNVAALQLAKGDLAGAEASLRDATRLKPGWAQAYLGLGHLYLRQKRFEDAERAFEHAAELAPTSVEALFTGDPRSSAYTTPITVCGRKNVPASPTLPCRAFVPRTRPGRRASAISPRTFAITSWDA